MAALHRVLQQRNAALRQAADDGDLDAWDSEFESTGISVSEVRTRYLARIRPNLESMTRTLLASDVTVEFAPGWPARTDLSTTTGPHRADLRSRIGTRLVKDTVSRGQQKLLAAAVIPGQLEFHRDEQSLTPTLLLDDPAAELDGDRLRQPSFDALGQPERTLHVEQGRVTRMYNPRPPNRGTHV